MQQEKVGSSQLTSPNFVAGEMKKIVAGTQKTKFEETQGEIVFSRNSEATVRTTTLGA